MIAIRLTLAAGVGLASAVYFGVAAGQPERPFERDATLDRLADAGLGRWVEFAIDEVEGEPCEDETGDAVRTAVGAMDIGEVDPAPAVEDLLAVLESWRSGEVADLYDFRMSAGLELDRDLARQTLAAVVRWGWLSAERGATLDAADDGEIVAMLMEAQRASGFVIEQVDLDSIEAGLGVATALGSEEWPPSGMNQFQWVFVVPEGMPAEMEELEDTPATFHLQLRVRFAGSSLGLIRLGYVFCGPEKGWAPVGAAYARFERHDRILGCFVN